MVNWLFSDEDIHRGTGRSTALAKIVAELAKKHPRHWINVPFHSLFTLTGGISFHEIEAIADKAVAIIGKRGEKREHNSLFYVRDAR